MTALEADQGGREGRDGNIGWQRQANVAGQRRAVVPNLRNGEFRQPDRRKASFEKSSAFLRQHHTRLRTAHEADVERLFQGRKAP